ncbi:MAG TPA: hypothetical protein VIW67_02580 [Terriglobales bacterium]|jgi:hypothetical protein
MAMDSNANDWRVIAEQASCETDPAKLLALAQKLNNMLEAEETQKQGPPTEAEREAPIYLRLDRDADSFRVLESPCCGM